MFKSFFAALAIVLVSYFGGHHVAAPSQPAAAAVAVVSNDSTSANLPTSTVSSPSTTTIVNQYITQPVIEHTIQTNTSQSLTQLQAEIAGLQVQISQLLSAQHPSYLSGAPAVQTFLGNTIPPLFSTLRAADIPTNIIAANYLPLAGGTLSGDLTLTGNLTVAGAQTLSGAITIPYLTATSTSVSSSFQQLLVNGSTTLQNFTGLNATTSNATSTTLFATLGHFTTGIIDSLTATAATITNLIVTTITGTNATFTNATTTNATSTNAFATNLTATNATTTAFAITGTVNALLSTNGAGSVVPTTVGNGLTYSGGVLSTSFGTTTANIWTALQQFQGNASTTQLSASLAYFGATATSSFSTNGALTLATPLLVSSGGTGATTFGQGWIYSIGGTSALAASTSPTVNYITATSTTATSTFAGNLAVGGNLNFNGSFLQNGSPFIGSQWTTNGSNIYYTAGNVGIGTTSPFSNLAVQYNYGSTNSTLFAIASSTASNGSSASTLFSVSNTGNVSIGTRLSLSPTNGITDSQISSAAVPGLIRGNNANSFSTAPVSATPVAPYIYFHQVQAGSWSNGVVTLTLRAGSTDNYVGNGVDFITISGSTDTAYNGTFPLVAATSNTISYNRATNPGTYTGGSDGGYTDTNLEPTVQIQPNSPFGTALFLTPNPNCVPDGQDAGAPILAVSSGYHNFTWEIGCDAHSVSIWGNGYLKDFTNGYVNAWTSDHLLAWSNSPTANPSVSSNDDTSLTRVAAGTLGVGTGSQGSIAGTLLAGSVGIGTTTPYSRLTVWGSDAASSTSAFAVVNNASTTVFAVFDGGNAQLSGTLTQSSDQRLKTNIQSLDASSSLSLIDSLNPVTFNWINPDEGTTPQLGFIAQQVQPLFPALVSTTSATALTPGGTLGINYIGLISPIVSAIQALYTDVQSLEQTVAGFAESLVSNRITASQELCVGSTCVTPAQFQAMVAAANQSPSAAQPSPTGGTNPPESVTQNSASSTPPTIIINGDNPAIITIGDTYADLGATVSDTGQGQAGDTNLGLKYFLNGMLVSNIVLDTSAAATDTIDYVATDIAGNTATSTRTVIISLAVQADTASTTTQ